MMAANVQEQEYDEIAREIESDLASLASLSALELTRFIRKQSSDFGGVRRLAAALSLEKSAPEGKQLRIFVSEPLVEVALIDAITQIDDTGRVPTTPDEILMESQKIVGSLLRIADNHDENARPEAENMRKFCLALCQAISNLSEPVFQKLPEHPDIP